MRILWLCNVMLPIVGEYLNKPFSNGGGWLTGLSQDLLQSKEKGLEFAVCFPMENITTVCKGTIEKKENKKKLQYFGFPRNKKNDLEYEETTEIYLKEIVEEYQPDMVHIFGTEFSHTLSMTRVFEKKEQILIGMQGVMSVYAKLYEANLPNYIVNRYTFRDWIKRDNIKDGKKKYQRRAKYELEALNNIVHVLGRTKFDFDETLNINPNRMYHKLNETLRDVFYKERWELAKMDRHTIFVSQGDYPLKGLHFILQALPEVIKVYPDTKLYVAGNQIVPEGSIISYIKRPSYGKYLQKLIRKNQLQEHVFFTGSLNAEQMCKRFQQSHVFVSASVIENSPNSIGEAMLLGMPVISSNVGGVPDMITDGKDGILVESANTLGFSKAIKDVFAKDEVAVRMGLKAHDKALQLHDREENFHCLLEIYYKIGKHANEG